MTVRGTRLHFFAADSKIARRLGATARLECAKIRMHRFPDGESMPTVATPPGKEAVLVAAIDGRAVNILDTLLAADALRRAGARRVTLVAPYLPYMRQDKVFHAGEPVSQRVVGALLGNAFDRVLTIEPHLHRIKRLGEVIRCQADSVSAAAAIAEWIKRNAPDSLVVGPDAESRRWIQSIARSAGVESTVGIKHRDSDRRVRVRFEAFSRRRGAIIVDDIASSGATLAAATRQLRALGIVTIAVIVVHAVFAPGAVERIRRAGAHLIVSCDTIRHATNSISIVPLLAAALRGSSE
jgi:ribose-phosphate pyrophosphokinase